MKCASFAWILVFCSVSALAAYSPYSQQEKRPNEDFRVHDPDRAQRELRDANRAVNEAQRALDQSRWNRMRPSWQPYPEPFEQYRLDQEYFQNERDYQDAVTRRYWKEVQERNER